MKKLAFFLSLFLGCFWLFGYIDNPEIYGREHPELLSSFFASSKINVMLPYSQRQRTPKRQKHDWFSSSRISSNFQAASEATVWARTYGGGGDDVARSIQQTNDGGYIVAGRTRSFDNVTKAWILKLSSGGEIEWQRTYREALAIHVNSVQQTSDNGYIIAGKVLYLGFPYNDFLVLKLFPNGDIEWEHRYQGGLGDIPHSVQQTSNGGYIVAGLTASFGAGWIDIWVLKLSSNGAVEWQHTYGGSGEESDWNNELQRVTVLETSDKGYILAGDTQSFGAGESDIWLIKLSSDGSIEWQRTYGGQESETLYRCGPNIQLTNDGGYIIAGDTQSFGAGGVDMWLLKLRSDGSIEWQKTYGGEIGDRAHSIQLTNDGGYIVAGSTNSFGLGGLDFLLLKLSSDGDVEWEHTYGGEGSDEAKCLYHTNDNGYIIAGSTVSFGVEEDDILIFKLPSNGELSLCPHLVGNSNFIVSDTSVVPVDTSVIPIVTTAPTMDTDITVENTSVISNLLCWNLNQPPMNVSLKSEVNRSLFRGEAFNTISWEQDPYNSQFVIAEYRIYRKDAEDDEEYQLIDSVPGNTLAYVDGYLDFNEEFVYVVTSVDSDSNESPRSESVSISDSVSNVENSNNAVSDTKTSSSDTKITRKDTKVYSQPKAISKDILVRSKQFSQDLNQNPVQPPLNVLLTRGEDSQTIRWRQNPYNSQSVAEYRIYRKLDGESDESYVLIGSVPGTESEFVDNVPDTYKEFVYAVTTVNSDYKESKKSKAVRK